MITKDNLFDYQSIKEMSSKYAIPETDILLIALNRFGLRANIFDNRLRFKLRPFTTSEAYYLAVCINTFESPFSIGPNGNLYLNYLEVGEIFDVEKDTCDTTYFRRNQTELTLNSNMRSQCEGCTFCGTYNLEPEDQIDMSDDGKIRTFLESFLSENKAKDLSNLVRITICTGCFADERKLVDHIISVYRVCKEYGFTKRVRYIGSQIQSEDAMCLIEQSIPFFSLSLTVECFSNRQVRMRKEKARLDMTAVKDILSRSMAHQFSTNFLYIVGLDEMNVMREGIQNLAKHVNRLPVFQVLQNYLSEHEEERVTEARKISYYLEARKYIESVFEDTDFRPRSWENYRGLFYTTFRNTPLQCIRI